MLTCKQFLQELDQYLEKSLDPAEYAELQKHVNECPNCFVVCDTTEKTIKVFKGMDCKPVPTDIRERLMAAVEQKMQQKMHQNCDHAHPHEHDSSGSSPELKA